MKNNYFLTYGLRLNKDISLIKSEFESCFDIVLSKRHSDFLGEYFLGKNDTLSRVTIEPNYVEYLDDWKEDSYKESTHLLKASFLSISSEDKENILNIFCKKVEDIFEEAFLIKLKELPIS